MRKLFTVLVPIFFGILFTTSVFAQTPQKFSYQAVIRDANNNLVQEQPVSMQISILQGSTSGTVVFAETHSESTNYNGLVSIEIGGGTTVSGIFAEIDWSNGPYFIQTETDPNGGNDYTITGVSELLSVPYALHANTAEEFTGEIIETDPLFTAWDKDYNDLINTPIIPTVPENVSEFINDANYLTPAEYQDLQLTGSTLTITNHPSPTGIDLSPYMGENTDEQTLILDGNELSITNGNTVILPSGETLWIKDENDVYYNDMNEGQARLYFHPNGNMSYNSDWDGDDVIRFYIYEDNDSDETTVLDASTQGGTGILGNVTATSDDNHKNVGVRANANTQENTSARAMHATIGGEGTGGYGLYIDANVQNGWNTGIQTYVMSREGNSEPQTGIYVQTTGAHWEGVGFGTGEHTGISANAAGGGRNIGVNGVAVSIDGNTNETVGGIFNAGPHWDESFGQGTGPHIGVRGISNAANDQEWGNVGVEGLLVTKAGTSGRGVNGNVYGNGAGGHGVRGEASTETGWNIGVSGFTLSTTGNSSNQYGGYFLARGDWDPENGVGTGNHFGIISSARGAGDWNLGVHASAEGSSPTGNNYGGQFTATSEVETNGFHYGIRAEAVNSSFVNRGIVALTSGNGQANQGGLFQATGTGHPTETTGNHGIYAIAGNNRIRNYGVYGYAYATEHADVTFLTGVYGEVWTDCAEDTNFGVDGTVHSTGNNNIGVGGFSHGYATNEDQDAENIGVWGYAQNADINYAVYAQSTGSGGLVNYGIYAEADSATNENFAGFFEGDVVVTGNLEIIGDISKGSGTFKIDHPLDPKNKYLVHSFVESPEMMNVYSGNITTDANGFATVKLPDYFEAANKDFRYQLTCIGTFAQAIVKEEIANNSFVVQTNESNVKVSWQVTAVRNDKYAQQNRIEPEQLKEGNKRGRYLHPEVYGADQSLRIYNRKDSRRNNEIIERKNQAHEINKRATKMPKQEKPDAKHKGVKEIK